MIRRLLRRLKPIPHQDPHALADHLHLMRHDNPECAIPEHADALRQLGRAIQERDQARELAQHLEQRCARLQDQLDELGSRLRHPARRKAA